MKNKSIRILAQLTATLNDSLTPRIVTAPKENAMKLFCRSQRLRRIPTLPLLLGLALACSGTARAATTEFTFTNRAMSFI